MTTKDMGGINMNPYLRGLAAVAMAASSGGCTSTASNNQQQIISPLPRVLLTSAQRQAVKDGVKAVLKDPGSAQFGGYVAGTTPSGSTAVCGWINSKNSYGGYVGMGPFALKLDGVTANGVIIEDTQNSFGIARDCEKIGLELPAPRKPTT